jgi:RNA polymerase sigma factor (sigma-70 family)
VERVHRALARLDPAQQEVVVLRFLAGLSLREVALTLNKTVAAVKSLQHRGLAALRAALKQE